MMILYSKLVGSPIAELKDSTKIGTISDLIVNDTDLTVAAAVIESGMPLISKKKVVAATDFIKILKDGIVVGNEDMIVEMSEVVRIESLYKRKCHGLSQKVVTKSGAYIGHVYDYLIDATTAAIRKLYVKKLLSDRIIPVSAVLNMEGKLITIKDDKPYVFVPTVETALE